MSESITQGLVLASASPRREELLRLLGLDFTVDPSGIDEPLEPGRPPEEQAQELAAAKAQVVARRWPEDVIIAADTLVVLEGRVLGKPADRDEAARMLRSLRGREHRVVTGVAVSHPGGSVTRHRQTRVWMRDYSDAELDAYVASGGTLDKAGAYAIQDAAFRPVDRLEGCHCNVVGLPLGLLLRLLREVETPAPSIARPQQCAGCEDWSE